MSRNGIERFEDASRLFNEHFADVLTSRLGVTRSEAPPAPFVDLARDVLIAVHVDDLIMVGSRSQLYDVVGEMKQYFNMKVSSPLSASSTQMYVGARYLHHHDAIGEFPTTRCVEGMLNEHGMKVAEHVVTLALARSDDDEDEEKASTQEHRILRRCVGKSQLLAPRRRDIAFATNRQARSLAKPSKSDLTASKRILRHLCTTLTVYTDSDRASDRLARKSVSCWVIMLDGFLLSAGARTLSVIAKGKSRPPQPRVKRSASRLCSCLVGNT